MHFVHQALLAAQAASMRFTYQAFAARLRLCAARTKHFLKTKRLSLRDQACAALIYRFATAIHCVFLLASMPTDQLLFNSQKKLARKAAPTKHSDPDLLELTKPL